VERTARLISHLAAPAILVSLLLLSLPLREPGVSWGSALLATVFTTGLPWIALLLARRAGRVSDIHVTRREQRWPLLVFCLVSIAAGLGLLAWTGAPGAVMREVLLVLAGLIVTGAVTLWWKISIHAAVAAFVFFTAGAGVPWGAHAAAAGLVLVCWSRVRLNHHTPSQVAAGSLVGLAVSLAGWFLTA
jgi:membrane-associated phospholipid phosphatase